MAFIVPVVRKNYVLYPSSNHNAATTKYAQKDSKQIRSNSLTSNLSKKSFKNNSNHTQTTVNQPSKPVKSSPTPAIEIKSVQTSYQIPSSAPTQRRSSILRSNSHQNSRKYSENDASKKVHFGLLEEIVFGDSENEDENPKLLSRSLSSPPLNSSNNIYQRRTSLIPQNTTPVELVKKSRTISLNESKKTTTLEQTPPTKTSKNTMNVLRFCNNAKIVLENLGGYRHLRNSSNIRVK